MAKIQCHLLLQFGSGPTPATTHCYTAEDRPYIGSFIAALVLQRSPRFVDVGFSLAKHLSELLVANIGKIAQSLDAEVLASDRGFKQMPDPFVLTKMFEGLVRKKFQALDDALEHYKCASNKKRILEDTCLSN